MAISAGVPLFSQYALKRCRTASCLSNGGVLELLFMFDCGASAELGEFSVVDEFGGSGEFGKVGKLSGSGKFGKMRGLSELPLSHGSVVLSANGKIQFRGRDILLIMTSQLAVHMRIGASSGLARGTPIHCHNTIFALMSRAKSARCTLSWVRAQVYSRL